MAAAADDPDGPAAEHGQAAESGHSSDSVMNVLAS
jgi:hypothetical protein